MLLFFIFNIFAAFLAIAAWFAILFTGRYPKGMFDFQVDLRRWLMRFNASMQHLTDVYPTFGLKGTSDQVVLDIPYPESLSRGLLLLKAFFGTIYCGLPHTLCLGFRYIASGFLSFLAFWTVLFTGKYPENWHAFNVGSLRWFLRYDMYLNNLSDTYPPFSGKEV
jgi:hypothetical protein